MNFLPFQAGPVLSQPKGSGLGGWPKGFLPTLLDLETARIVNCDFRDSGRRFDVERLTIVGMSPISASIGLRLKQGNMRDTEIVGTSGDRRALSIASEMGALDKSEANLRSAVDGARLVILDMPITETRDLLEAIGPILREGCVVTDTGTTKVPVMEWADQFLPRGVSFVGGHPLVKRQLTKLEDATPSMFDGIDYCVLPAKTAGQNSVGSIVGLVETLGAKPLFIDPHEHDSYAAAMIYLPTVLSSAFVTATTGSDGWRDMQRLAASDFAEFSRAASQNPEVNQAASLASPDSLVHWLDQMILELYSYRNRIKDRSDGLLDIFVNAWEARAKWEAGVVVDDDTPPLPSAADAMTTSILGGRLAEHLRKNRHKEQKASWRYIKKN